MVHYGMRIERIVLIIGFTILIVTVSMLYIISGIESIQHHWLIALLKAVMFVGFLYEVFLDAKREYHEVLLTKYFWNQRSLYEIAAVVIGAVITYFISIELGHGGVIASAIVGMTTVIIFPQFAVAAYCGSFVGMASTIVFASYEELLLAGVLAAVIFVIAKPACRGFGGKLGTIAFAGTLLSITILDAQVISSVVPDLEMGVSLIALSIAGAYLTYLINVILRHGPVIASSLIGLIAGLVLPAVYGTETGTTLALMVFCASFAGMSSRERIRSWYFIVAAGALSALIFIFSMPYMGGAGGKMGTIAFGAVISITGIDKLLQRSAARNMRK